MFPICLPLPVFLSVSFPATRWSAMKGDGDGNRSQKERLSAAASEGSGKINFRGARKFEEKKV